MRLRNILILGLLIRLAMAPFFAHPFDVYAWYVICRSIIERGPYFVSYFPPMLFYTFMPIAYLYDWVARVFSAHCIPVEAIPSELNPFPQFRMECFTDILFNGIVKIPFIISDILAAVLLFKIVLALSGDTRLANRGAALWFLNPYLIWISTGWGMFDTLPATCSLGSFYMLLKRKVSLSAVLLGIAVAYKLYPVLFLIPIALFLLRTKESKEMETLVRFLFSFALTSAILFAPSVGRVLDFSHGLLALPPEIGRLGFGLTYWSALLMIKADQTTIAILSNLFLAVTLGWVFFRLGKLPFEGKFFDLAAAELCCILAVYVSFRFIAEQFFVWSLPFLTIAVLEKRVEEVAYRSLCLIAVAYSIVNLLFPFFLLSTAPWTQSQLLAAVKFLRHGGLPEEGPGNPLAYVPHVSATTVILTTLGSAFTILTVIVVIESLLRKGDRMISRALPNRVNGLLRRMRIQVEV